MAGTLTVQNIQGPASGANANKIIIPSGQTLELPSGNNTASSQTEYTSYGSFTTTSYVDLITAAITPASTSSKILVLSNFSCNIDTATNDRVWFALYRGDTLLFESRLEADVGNDQRSLQFIDSPSTTSSVTYKLRGRAPDGGSFAMNDNGNSILSVMEFKS